MSHGNTFESGKSRRHEAVIFDLDGTLADTTDPEAKHKVKDDGFRAMARTADTNEDIVAKAKKAKAKGRDVVVLTARSDHYRADTARWLHENGIPYDSLVMRPKNDARKDRVVKEALLREDVLPHFDPVWAIDDKAKNRKMYEKHGIKAKGVK